MAYRLIYMAACYHRGGFNPLGVCEGNKRGGGGGSVGWTISRHRLATASPSTRHRIAIALSFSLFSLPHILSDAEHEEFCANPPGPSGKAKYSRETDSEPVP